MYSPCASLKMFFLRSMMRSRPPGSHVPTSPAQAPGECVGVCVVTLAAAHNNHSVPGFNTDACHPLTAHYLGRGWCATTPHLQAPPH
jgi:hypothetical protein